MLLWTPKWYDFFTFSDRSQITEEAFNRSTMERLEEQSQKVFNNLNKQIDINAKRVDIQIAREIDEFGTLIQNQVLYHNLTAR